MNKWVRLAVVVIAGAALAWACAQAERDAEGPFEPMAWARGE